MKEAGKGTTKNRERLFKLLEKWRLGTGEAF
jgi:hypothetical protein